MEIGIIGYRGHSLKLLRISLKQMSVKKIIIFCRSKNKSDELNYKNSNKKIKYTYDFNDLINSRAVIVSSSNESHVSYIKKLLNEDLYIFCEKPACTNIKDYNFLSKLKKSDKSRIYFNYNFKKSQLNTDIKKILSYKKFGKPVHVTIESSQGIAFKDWFRNNWRSSKDIFKNVSGNLGVHYINLLEGYFGKPKKIFVKINSISGNQSNDTGIVNIHFNNNISATLVLTYAAPYSQQIKFLLSNSIISYKDNTLAIYYPRDTFSKDGLFIHPKKVKMFKYKKNFSELSQEESLKYFFNNVNKKKFFSVKDFDSAISTSKSMLDARYI